MSVGQILLVVVVHVFYIPINVLWAFNSQWEILPWAVPHVEYMHVLLFFEAVEETNVMQMNANKYWLIGQVTFSVAIAKQTNNDTC